MSDAPDTIEQADKERADRYEQALREIERFPHKPHPSEGHPCFVCIARRALEEKP